MRTSIQIHFVRGEKSTDISGWGIQDWEHLKNYLQGTLGIESTENLETELLSSNCKDEEISHFESTIRASIGYINKKRDSFQNFDPMTFTVLIEQQVVDLLSWINEKIFPKDGCSTCSATNELENHTEFKKQSTDKTPRELLVKPFCTRALSEYVRSELEFRNIESLEGYTGRVIGTGFYVFIDEHKGLVEKSKIKKYLPDGKTFKNFMPIEGDLVEFVLQNNEIRVVLHEKENS